ncbi:MAG: ATP-binding protein [Piscirickettsiaceae bacterium]|nr:ATP-binding protein [Piscirickettsiaceae bacterium]
MTNNDRIHTLSLHLSNQIAAGEVIARPASIVKELVENSIDAGASQIDIKIYGAGSKLIQVHDNGNGIHADDLILAIRRHTTNKLYSSEHLKYIDSLGFRGEALHSISSVSMLSITSRRIDSNCGWRISGDHNKIGSAPHPSGTTIEANDLFFNLPARRRFLRSNRTEQYHILKTIYHLALSNFNI